MIGSLSRSTTPWTWVLVLHLFLILFPWGRSHAEIHEVAVSNFAFTPQGLTITDGDTVRWVWQSGIHTATSGSDCVADGIFNGPVDEANPVYEFTFDGQLGEIPYFCIPHCLLDMVGTITVLPQTSAAEEPLVDAQSLRALFRAAPNPFGPSTTLHFALAEPAAIRLAVYDAGGRVVTTLVDGRLDSGRHAIPWGGSVDAGGALPSGVYYAQLSAGDRVTVRPLTLVR